MTDRPDISPDPLGEAAEYVLGLMDAEARAAFETRLRAEPVLVAEVRSWEAYFATMAEVEVDGVTPPASVQRAVEAALFGPETTTGQSIWNRVAFWRGLSLATTALAAVAVGVAFLPDLRVSGPGEVPEVTGIPPGTLLMTHLVPIDGSGLGLAVTREPSGVLQVRRVAGSPGDGRAQELWLIAGDRAPISLGLLGDEPLTTLTPGDEAAQLFGTGASLAISDEPPGGSPTGAPTGAILALGTFIAL